VFDKFDRMKGNRWFVSVVIALLIFGCTKEEPFEFPEDPEDPQPQVIIEMQRVMKTSEQWRLIARWRDVIRMWMNETWPSQR
jgi:type IV pilus biogenesis protein CpaD/CtpE